MTAPNTTLSESDVDMFALRITDEGYSEPLIRSSESYIQYIWDDLECHTNSTSSAAANPSTQAGSPRGSVYFPRFPWALHSMSLQYRDSLCGIKTCGTLQAMLQDFLLRCVLAIGSSVN